MESYTLLRSPLDDSVRHLFSKCQRSIFIASPFINVYGINALVSALPDHVPNISIEVLTSITVKSLQDGSLDLDALIKLFDIRPLTHVVSLPRLHAKVYAVDDCRAIITSANFTRGGLVTNYEYGIALYDASLVQGISRDMRDYGSLGNVFTLEDLRKLAVEASQLRLDQERALQTQRSSDISKRLRLQIRELEDALLRSRV